MDYRAMPKAHLHLHLEGAVRASTAKVFYDRCHRNDPLSPDEFQEKLRLNGRPKDFSIFLSKFDYVFSRSVVPEDLCRAASEIIEDQMEDGVHYLELRFCPNSFEQRTGISPERSLNAVIRGIEQAKAQSNECICGLIVIIDQRLGPNAAEELFRTVNKNKFLKENICAFDIASDPNRIPLEAYASICANIREAGFGLTVHAGELAGPESVKTAVQLLGADRIGHGIRAADDREVIQLLKEREIPLEICLMSNYYTHAVDGLADHPLKRLMDAGVKVTVNTDDPMIFGKKLSEEYMLAEILWGLTAHDFYQMNLNAIDHAFVSDETKNLLHQKFDRIWDKIRKS